MSYDISRILLDAGAKPNFNQQKGRSVLDGAIILRNMDLLKLLLAHKANANHFNKFTEYQSPIGTAIATGNIEALKILVEHGANLQTKYDDKNSLIHLAIRYKQLDIVKYLLELGISSREKDTQFNPEGNGGDCVTCPFDIEPIHSAVELNDTILSNNFIDLLIKYKANLNIKNKDNLSPLAYIATDGHPKIARHLIKNGAEIDHAAIIQSSAFQNNDYLKVLLESGGNPNASTSYYESALHAAIVCCGDGFNEASIDSRIETLELLLKFGASPGEKVKKLIQENKRYISLQKVFEKHGS